MENNIYTQFIEDLRIKQYTKETKLEKHRILPQHAGGTYEVNNVVLCSFEDHRYKKNKKNVWNQKKLQKNKVKLVYWPIPYNVFN